jgi:hypothetical protein
VKRRIFDEGGGGRGVCAFVLVSFYSSDNTDGRKEEVKSK